MSDYPEHDKQRRVAYSPEAPADTLSRFIDWLAAQGIELATWGELVDESCDCPDCVTLPGRRESSIKARQRQVIGRLHGQELADYVVRHTGKFRECPTCHGTGKVWRQRRENDQLAPLQTSPQRLLARYFGVDLGVIERERRSMLDALRTANA